MPEFTSMSQVKDYILGKSQTAVAMAQERVYEVLDRYLDAFYGSYEPVYYERTRQLLRSLVKSSVRRVGNTVEAEVYFDVSSLSYSTGAKPGGLDVLGAAASGGHGANGLKVIPGSIGVWDDPMNIIRPEAIQMLVKYLRGAGIPLA